MERVFLCPRDSCQRLFIAIYALQSRYSSNYQLQRCVPAELQDVDFDENIQKISKDFGDIYNEAHKAESLGLELVCGPGYRKALEFLIKDYVCLLHPDDKEKIQRLPLAACIKEYVKNDKVQSTAKRATWLGNDETHYVRKWEEKDLKDLKKMIALTVGWIQMEELTKEAETDMPES